MRKLATAQTTRSATSTLPCTPASGPACQRYDFPCVFSAAVGSQSHSPEQDYCYKFRDRWIPVALPPPWRGPRGAARGASPPLCVQPLAESRRIRWLLAIEDAT